MPYLQWHLLHALTMMTTLPPSSSILQPFQLPLAAPKNVKVAGGDGIYTAKSSDDKTATVTVDKATITVKGVKAGKATVLVTDSKKVTGSLRITVVDGVVVDKAKTSIAVGKEDVVNISGGTTPYTAASKDDKIATATVKDAKLTIKGVKVGSTTITITDKNKKTATVVVTVTK